MPETRLAKTRRSLPEGYQFGDASLNARMGCPFGLTLTKESREQLLIWDRERRVFDQMTWQSAYRSGERLMVGGTGYESGYLADRDPGDETPSLKLRRRAT